MERGSHLARVLRRLGADEDLLAGLAALPAGDLRAVLLELSGRRAGRIRPAELLRRYAADPTVRPSGAPATLHHRFVGWALEQLPDNFDQLTLAPHAPLGTSSVLGRFSQDRAVTTIADTEVLSDSTNLLALECAHRRRTPQDRRGTPIRLAASDQLLRPRDRAHFGLLALCTAGRDTGSFAFELAALREHLTWHLEVIRGHGPQLRLRVRLTDLSGGRRRAALREQLVAPIAARWPAVEVDFDDDRRAGRNYYTEVCFAIDAVLTDAAPANLSDGGLTDWTARLLADAKERLLISGLGSERLLSVTDADR